VAAARAPRHRVRFAVGVVLACALGGWLSHRFAQQAVRDETRGVETRKAVVQLEALTALVQRAGGESEALTRAVAAWQAKNPSVAQARVLYMNGLRLAASTARADSSGERAAPRRLVREEKPFYDRGQRLATAVRTNREEGTARKEEIEIAPAPGGARLSLAGPIESGDDIVGMVEIETTELQPPAEEPLGQYLLALGGGLLAFGLGALVVPRRRLALAALAVVCVGAALAVLVLQATGRVDAARRGTAQAVADEVGRQAALGQALGADLPAAAAAPPPPPPASWDADAFRHPLGLLTADGKVDAQALAAAGSATDRALRRSLLAADLLALAVLLLVGLGAMNRMGSALRKNRRAYAYIAPAMIGVTILVFFPFIYGIALSFTNSNIYNSSASMSDIWIGLQNYIAILGDFAIVKHGEGGSVVNYLNFYWTLGFTVVWTVTNVTLGVTSGLILALILNTKALALRPLYRVLLILPWATPNYITALIWKGMFHRQYGVINQVLQMFGLSAVSWFEHPFTSYLTALATNGWLSFPFMMVVSLGALQSIPADLYEAARVDGASRWQAFRAITLPSLRPALVPAVIISVVWTFNMFNIIYLVTAGEPGGATEILVTQAYKFAFERYRYGYAAAYSTIIFLILLVYGAIQNRVSKAIEA
jgi:arabinogalactan oligomer / maltooligosaccharide transport system permease protein